MRHDWFYALLLLSTYADARPATSDQPSDLQAVANATQMTMYSKLQANDEEPYNAKPTFEELSASGVSKLRLANPYTELRMITAFPNNGAQSATSLQAFREVALIGYDTRSSRWLRIINKKGKDIWSDVQATKDIPKAIRDMPAFTYTSFPVTLEAAFEKVRTAGQSKPWAGVRLSAEVFQECPNAERSYLFIDAAFKEGIIIDAMTGDLYKLAMALTTKTGITMDTTSVLQNQSFMSDTVSTS